MLGAEGGGGGPTTHTRVSGEMVKPSMYNCLTLIKGGGSVGAKSPVSKPRGGTWGSGPLQVVVEMPVCGLQSVQARLYLLTAAAENT